MVQFRVTPCAVELNTVDVGRTFLVMKFKGDNIVSFVPQINKKV